MKGFNDASKNSEIRPENEITEEDLVEFVTGDIGGLSHQVREFIKRERLREDSPVWRWFQKFDDEFPDPFKTLNS